TGGLTREIQVNVDQDKLHSFGLTLDGIVEKLQTENIRLPGGSVKDGMVEMLTRTTGEFQSVEDIEELRLNESGLKLSEVAEVVDGESDDSQNTRINGVEGIGLSIQRESGANTVIVSQRLRSEVEEIQSEFGENINMNYVYDEADFITDSIGDLGINAALGALVAVLVLFIFLRSFKTTLIIGLAIPISVVATFVLMYFTDLTFNLMTLGGIALGIGMLVDNAIVVIENIYRMRQEGSGAMLAATEGSGEVASAIIASTLTTAAVFLPIVYIEGIASELFSELAMTVAFALFASLLVALTLIPMLASRLLNGAVTEKVSLGFVDRIGSKIKNLYGSVIGTALNHKLLTVLVVAVIFGASLLMIPQIGSEFIPPMDEGEIMVDVELPAGMVLAETREVALEIEEVVDEIPEVETVYTTVGSGGGQGARIGLASGGTNQASLEVSLVSSTERDRSTTEIINEMQKLTAGIPRSEISVEDMASDFGGMGGGSPVSVRIQGPDLDRLEEMSNQLARIVEDVRGTMNVETSFDEGRPEVVVRVDQAKSSELGIPAAMIANTVNTGLDGTVPSLYRTGG
ncbi:MAG: efflux RND transporter permease subunit, partial [Halarsenatibacteraceae bacterium]